MKFEVDKKGITLLELVDYELVPLKVMLLQESNWAIL